MPRYRVVHPVARGPRAEERLAPGEVVELPDEEAAALLAAGVVEALEAEQEQDEDSKPRRGGRRA